MIKLEHEPKLTFESNDPSPNKPPKQQNHAPNLLHAMPLAPITRRHQIPLQKPRNQKLQSLQNQTNPQTHARHAQSILHPHALDDLALGIHVLGIVPKSDDGEEEDEAGQFDVEEILGGIDPAGDSGGEFGGGGGGVGVGVGIGDVGYGYLGFVVFLFVAGGGAAFFGAGFAGGSFDGGVVGFFVAVGHDNYYLLK